MRTIRGKTRRQLYKCQRNAIATFYRKYPHVPRTNCLDTIYGLNFRPITNLLNQTIFMISHLEFEVVKGNVLGTP